MLAKNLKNKTLNHISQGLFNWSGSLYQIFQFTISTGFNLMVNLLFIFDAHAHQKPRRSRASKWPMRNEFELFMRVFVYLFSSTIIRKWSFWICSEVQGRR